MRALHSLHQQQPSKIERISVLCRTDKPVDRGLKTFRTPPIKTAAQQLGLQLHQIDTFQDWSPPESYNLVVAVSFGLLVPKKVLDAAAYGGLNVHPSMLPDLRGSAPIIQTLLKRRTSTGVSLQTMHPTKFDHGIVLQQTKEIPIPTDSTPSQLLEQLGPLGAEILCQGIEEAIFVPPLRDVRAGVPAPAHVDLASKIKRKDREIDWNTWTAQDVFSRDRVLGDLWDRTTFELCQSPRTTFGLPQSRWSSAGKAKRITFHGPWMEAYGDVPWRPPGEPGLVLNPFSKGRSLGIRTVDGHSIVPQSVTIEGKKKGGGLQALNDQLRQRTRVH